MSDAPWERWFAIIPVTVDAYSEAEIRDGKMSYRVVGWVERQLVPEHYDDEGDYLIPQHYKYRLPQK